MSVGLNLNQYRAFVLCLQEKDKKWHMSIMEKNRG